MHEQPRKSQVFYLLLLFRRDCRVSKDLFYDDGYDETDGGDGNREFGIVPRRIWRATPGTDLAAIIDRCVSVGIVNNIG